MLSDLVKCAAPLPKNSKLLIFGGGFSGQHIAKLFRAHGSEVICSRRKINQSGADIAFDSSTGLMPPEEALNGITHLISCIPPSADGKDPVLTKLTSELKKMPLQWVGYLSTTGVYGDRKGNWVNEKDLPQPKQLRSKRRLSCEKAWQATGLPLQILRLPGIYGPGRSAIETIKNGKARMIDKPNQVFSRIHIDDIAGAIAHLIELSANRNHPSIINIADDLPIANIEVLKYAAKLLNAELPKIEPFDLINDELSPMALSFWEENRRVSNEMLCKNLGYKMIHPNYKFGLRDCLKSES